MADTKWPLRINITEEDFWAPYDYASDPGNGRSGIEEWSSDSAWSDFQNLPQDSCREYLQDLIDSFLTKAQAKKITDEDLNYLCEHVTDVEMDEVRHAMVDAFTFAWEDAYTPTDLDIQHAVEHAGDGVELPSFWDNLLAERPSGPKDWSPLPSYSQDELFNELESGVSFHHKPGYWDRFLVFDWKNGPVIRHLRRKLAETPEEFTAKDFENDLETLANDFVRAVGKRLDRVFQKVDVHMRVDATPHWISILKDKSRKKGIQEEILAAVQAHRKEEAENAEGLQGE